VTQAQAINGAGDVNSSTLDPIVEAWESIRAGLRRDCGARTHVLHGELVDDDEDVVVRPLWDVLTSCRGSVQHDCPQLRAVDFLKLSDELFESHGRNRD